MEALGDGKDRYWLNETRGYCLKLSIKGRYPAAKIPKKRAKMENPPRIRLRAEF